MKKISVRKVLVFFIIISLILNIIAIYSNNNESTATSIGISDNEPESENISTIGSRASYSVYDLNRGTNKTHHNLTIYGAYALRTSGDFNADGILDIVISHGSNGPVGGRKGCGAISIIYGNTTYLPVNNFDELKDLTIYGANSGDNLGLVHLSMVVIQSAVATGDVNGDGIDDIICSAVNAYGENNLKRNCGEVYVFFGSPTLPPTWDLNTNAANVTIIGKDAGDYLGTSLGAGDINDDGIDDILLGAFGAQGPNNTRVSSYGIGCGEAYVIFGNSTLPTKIDLDKTTLDILIYGRDYNDRLGSSIECGDFNNDGINDLIIGAERGYGYFNNLVSSGEVYILYGNTSWPITIDLLYTPANITIYGEDSGDILGAELEVGDLNGDKIDDLIISALWAKGRSDNYTYCGDVWIVFGNETPLHNYNSSDVDLKIYGQWENHQFGISLHVGNYNNDEYDDLMIGAPGGDGYIGSFRTGAGEAWILKGNASWPRNNFDIDSLDVLILGEDSGDYTGQLTLFADINGDRRDDILIGAAGSEGRNNDQQTSGEIYVILSGGDVVSIPEVYQVSLENGHGDDDKICYAGLKVPVCFKVVVVTHDALNDITFVTLDIVFKEASLGLQFGWTKASGEFFELKDPNNLFELSDACSFSNDGKMTWTLNFHMIFHLKFPYMQYYTFNVHTESESGHDDWLNLTRDMFRVESRFDLYGDLTVTGASQGILQEDSWVHGNENITWSGPNVVYFESEIIPPADLGISITVRDGLGNNWTVDHMSTEPISINTTAVNETKENVLYLIKITGIPLYLDMSDITFSLKVDADGVEFFDRFPEPVIWHTTLRPECGIRINDSNTNVSQLSVQYRTSTDAWISWDSWTKLGIQYELFDEVLNCSVKPVFKDGAGNRIQWRARDIVGNVYNQSPAYQVRVDVSNVMFKDPKPEPTELQRVLNVTCGITVIDDLSGVDGDSIDYSISTSGIWDYGDWQSARKTVDGKEINCTVTPTFVESSENYIRWRAKDLVGNGYHVSDNYRVRVKLNNPPVCSLVSPKNNTVINILTPTLIWESSDPDNDTKLRYDLYISHDKEKVLNYNETALFKTIINQTSYRSEIPLEDKTIYYWTVIPNDGLLNGTCLTSYRQFRIDTTVELPVVTLTVPKDNTDVTTTTPKLAWKLNYSNPDIVTYDIYYSSKSKLDLISTENLYKKDYKLTIFIIDKPLTFGERYYWTVIPIADTDYGKLTGLCKSGIWTFRVELPVEKFYHLDLALEKQKLRVVQGNYTSMNISVFNLGNTADTVEVSVDKGILDANVGLERSGSPIWINKSDVIRLKLEILVSEDAKPQNNTISITATSAGGIAEGKDIANASITKTLILWVQLKTQVPIEDGGGKGGEKTDELTMMIWTFFIIILILIIALFIYVYRSRRIPYVKSELLTKLPEYLRLPGISGKPGTELELPAAVGEDGVIALEGTAIPITHQLPKAVLTKDQELKLLRERFLLKEISEEKYDKLRAEIESSEDITDLDEVEPVDEMPEDMEAPELEEPVVDEEEPVDKESMEAMEEEPPSEVEDLEGLEVQETEDTEVVEKPEKEPEPSIGPVKEIRKPKKKKTAITKKKKPKKVRDKKQESRGPVEEPVAEDEMHDIPEEVHPFPDDGLCITCGQSLDLDMAYCWSCGTKYELKKK